MRWFCAILAVAVLSLFVGTKADAAKAKKAAKKAAAVTGTVVSISKDSITVATAVKAKKGQPAAKSEEKTFKLSDSTKAEKVTGKPAAKKQPAPTENIAVNQVAKDSRVSVSLNGDTVSSIKVLKVPKAKKKAKKAK